MITIYYSSSVKGGILLRTVLERSSGDILIGERVVSDSEFAALRGKLHHNRMIQVNLDNS